jgi:hypothetical protein
MSLQINNNENKIYLLDIIAKDVYKLLLLAKVI